MTDEELTMLLRQWQRTPAPPSLDARVFDASTRKNRRWVFPAPAVALAGAAAGVLAVLVVLRLTMPAVHTPPPVPALEQAALPDGPPMAPAVLPPPTPTVTRRPKAKAIIKADVPPVAMDTQVAESKRLFAPVPVYPPDAREALVEGKVRVQVRIGKDGRVIEATVLSGDPLLVDAALESVKQWLYEPTVLNGEPIEVITQVDVNFTLLDRKPRPVKK